MRASFGLKDFGSFGVPKVSLTLDVATGSPGEAVLQALEQRYMELVTPTTSAAVQPLLKGCWGERRVSMKVPVTSTGTHGRLGKQGMHAPGYLRTQSYCSCSCHAGELDLCVFEHDGTKASPEGSGVPYTDVLAGRMLDTIVHVRVLHSSVCNP